MLTSQRKFEIWNGVNRRVMVDRRQGDDRRNLVRIESWGCDRRLDMPRRKAEIAWEQGWFLK
jgi:hypothetical protein